MGLTHRNKYDCVYDKRPGMLDVLNSKGSKATRRQTLRIMSSLDRRTFKTENVYLPSWPAVQSISPFYGW